MTAARDRLLEVLLEEELAGRACPDLAPRMAAAAPERRQAAAVRAAAATRSGGWDRARRRWWPAAALVALGAAIAFAIGLEGRGAGGRAPAGSAAAQDPEPVVLHPRTPAELEAALQRTARIACEVWRCTAPTAGIDLRGSPPLEVTDPDRIAAIVSALRRRLRPTLPGRWGWTHRFTFALDRGEVLHLALGNRRLLGVAGAPGDFLIDDSADTLLRELVAAAEWRARKARGIVLRAGELAGLPDDLEALQCHGLADADLAGLARFAHLRHLDLGGCPDLTDAGMPHLARLTSLEELRLRRSSSSLTDRGLRALAALSHLRELDLTGAGPGLTGAGFDAFAEHRFLQIVRLGDNAGLSDEGLRRLAALPALQELELWGAGLGRVRAEGLLALTRARRLWRLQLSDCTLPVDPLLQQAAGWQDLQQLRLGGTDATASGLRGLAGLPALRELDLSRCAGLDGAALEELLPLQGLQRLRLAQVPLGDGEHAALGQLPALRYLDLRATGIGDRTLKTLARLRGLRRLDLQDNPAITAEAAAVLQFSLPDCEIAWPERIEKHR